MSPEAAASTPAAKPQSKGLETRTAVLPDKLKPLILLEGKPAVGLFVLYATVPSTETVVDLSAKAAGLEEPAFCLAYVDAGGYLCKVQDINPWAEIATARARASRKLPPALEGVVSLPAEPLMVGVKYDVVLVAHPSAHLARALLKFLNTGEKTPGVALPETKTAIKRLRVTVTMAQGKGGKRGEISLPVAAAADCWPLGSSRYDGWNLYPDMPYRHLPAVGKALKLATQDLARLRFPACESGNAPYPTTDPWRQVGVKDQFSLKGIADATLGAVVLAFQEAAAGGKAARLSPLALAAAAAPTVGGRVGPKASWAYLLADEVTLEGPKPARLATFEPAVIDRATGDAIAAWVDSKDLIRQGSVLIEVCGGMSSRSGALFYGRPELVFAIEALRHLVVALGCPLGIVLGHTFRELSAPGGVGRAQASNHKLGLAVDFISNEFRDFAASWPVRFEAQWVDERSSRRGLLDKNLAELRKKTETESSLVAAKEERLAAVNAKLAELKARVENPVAGTPPLAQRTLEATLAKETKAVEEQSRKLEEARKKLASKQQETERAARRREAFDTDAIPAKSDLRLQFRIFGGSTLDALGDAAKFEEAVVKAMGRHPEAKPGDRVEDKYRKLLESNFAPELLADDKLKLRIAALLDPWVKQVGEAADRLVALAKAPEAKGETSELAKQMFRETVRPFNYNPFEADGGESLPPTRAKDEAMKHPPAFDGRPQDICAWLNISRVAHEVGLHPIPSLRAGTKVGIKAPNKDPEYVGKVLPMVRLPFDRKTLGAIARGIKDLQGAHPLLPLEEAYQVALDRAGEAETKYPPGDFDVEAIRAWAALKPVEARVGGVALGALDLTVSVAVLFKAFPPEKGGSGDTEAANNQRAWPANTAAAIKAISDIREATAGIRVEVVAVGEALQGALAVGGVFEWRILLETLGKEMNRIAPESRSSTKGDGGAFSIVLRPRFWSTSVEETRRTPGPETNALLPPSGQPAPLEWWHHEEKTIVGKKWGDVLAEIGYAPAFIKAHEPPVSPQPGQICMEGLDFERVDHVRKTASVPSNGFRELEGG